MKRTFLTHLLTGLRSIVYEVLDTVISVIRFLTDFRQLYVAYMIYQYHKTALKLMWPGQDLFTTLLILFS